MPEEIFAARRDGKPTWWIGGMATEDAPKYIRADIHPQQDVQGLVENLQNYYLPQLKFSMGGHRAFAIEHADNKEISASHHGAANAFETAIGCIEEALKSYQEGRG